jgi:hypothetical protein
MIVDGASVPCDLSLEAVDERNHPVIEWLVVADQIIEFLVSTKVFRQLFVELPDLVGSISTVVRDCTFDAGAHASPDLLFTIFRANKEDIIVLGCDGRARQPIPAR